MIHIPNLATRHITTPAAVPAAATDVDTVVDPVVDTVADTVSDTVLACGPDAADDPGDDQTRPDAAQQLRLLDASDLPLQHRLDLATRQRGLAHVAEIRRMLAAQAARAAHRAA